MATLLEIYESFENGQRKHFIEQVNEYGFNSFVEDINIEQIDGILTYEECFNMMKHYILHSNYVEKKAEYLVLSEYLSEWNENDSYSHIVQTLHDAKVCFPENITACEFFEDWHPPTLAERIESLKNDIVKAFK